MRAYNPLISPFFVFAFIQSDDSQRALDKDEIIAALVVEAAS